jgi:nitrate reductase NapE component
MGTDINWRALAIAGSAGFVLELILVFAGIAAKKGTEGGMFGASQQDQALAVFSALVLGIFGLLASASIGGLYAWLSRSSSLSPRAITLGGAVAAILPAFAAKALGGIAAVASLPAMGNQTVTGLAVGAAVILVMIVISVAIGGAMGALGSWLTQRLIISRHA